MRELIEPYVNVVRLARKPRRKEFWKVAKITAAGILVIGGMGFLTYLLMDILPGYMAG